MNMKTKKKSMAAHIARRSCLLSISGGLNLIRINMTRINPSLQPSVGFRIGETNLSQDVKVQVPVERLRVSYSKSSGPGGQNVNKVSTKAEVRFHVLTADWIPEDVRQKIFEKNKNRINKAGELLVTSELSRSQQRNLSDCVQKISVIVSEASRTPQEPTAEDVALRAARLEKMHKERLKQKKVNSAIKRSRRVDFD